MHLLLTTHSYTAKSPMHIHFNSLLNKATRFDALSKSVQVSTVLIGLKEREWVTISATLTKGMLQLKQTSERSEHLT